MVEQRHSNGEQAILAADSPAIDPSSLCTAFMRLAASAIGSVSAEGFAAAVHLLRTTIANRRRIYIFGNGGSAATATHLAGDLTKRPATAPASRVRAFALLDNTPLVTALANDIGYQSVFAQQVTALIDGGDVAVALSVSGRSPNILAGLRAARAAGAATIGLLGQGGGDALGLVDIALVVASREYGVVETAHLAIVHALSAALGSGRTSPSDIVRAAQSIPVPGQPGAERVIW